MVENTQFNVKIVLHSCLIFRRFMFVCNICVMWPNRLYKCFDVHDRLYHTRSFNHVRNKLVDWPRQL